jgi:hypothetical protein
MKKVSLVVKKAFSVAVITLVICIVLVIAFVSPLTKYLLEKYDVRLIGRELIMDWAYVNPFTGYVHLNDLQIFEVSGDSLFLSAESVSANFTLHKLLFKTVEITDLIIDRPRGKAIKRKNAFNFDDIVRRFAPDKSDKTNSSWKVLFLGIKIVGGEFRYIEQIIPINYVIKSVNIESPGIVPGIDTLSALFSFREGKSSGDVKGDFTMNVMNLDYRLAVAVHDFDLEIIRQYIWELINYGMFSARLDANIRAVGNFSSKDSISFNGRLILRDFHLGKTKEDDYLSFKKLAIVMEEVSPVHHKYLFDSITLLYPRIKYERYDSLDNVGTMFGRMGKNISDVTQQPGRFNLVIEIGRYIEVLSRNFFKSRYKINQLGIYNADLTFNDYSLVEKFSIQASALTVKADSIDNNQKRVGVSLASDLKPSGKAKFLLSINPRDSGDFDFTYDIEKIPASVFNPYLLSYTSFPVDRGTLEINGVWNVRNGEIKSINHIVVIDPRVTRQVRNKDAKWIPMPLIMSFIRERGNVIDYSVPITGDLRNPRFHIGDIVFDLVKNIFIKPPTTPYGIEVKNIEKEIEESLMVKWDMRQSALRPYQKKFITKISRFLRDNPEVLLNVHPIEYSSKEREYILFFEAKRKYFLLINNKDAIDFNAGDSLAVCNMSVKDMALVAFISRNLSDTVMFTIQEKCINFVGNRIVDIQLKKLAEGREVSFRESFLANGTDHRVKMYATENDIPYNGFSYFKLGYPGEIPSSLHKAYQEMIDLNDGAPRKKYLERRRQRTY